MNCFKPSQRVEFEDKYIDAKNKLVDFISALNKLTEVQRQQLANEIITSISISASFEQFVKYMNNGGRF